ncbi:TPA: type 1 fimbrial protein [Escherichia coli]|nr:type 1 fimbrial protein [Escherichia coli]
MKRLHKRFLLATFCALFTATLQAADVTITVNGRVVAKPCTIQTKEANVNLGDLYTRNLQQPGSASGWHNITLSLTDCPVETSAVTAIVTGSTDNTGYYKNEGTAENIQVPLGLSATYGQTGNKVSAGTAQSVIGVTFIYE